jgi:ribosome biogenesis GTPase
MNFLEEFGWNPSLQKYSDNNPNQSSVTGRVISIQGFKYHLITANGELEAELSGKMLYASDAEDLPKVGDWVFCIAYDSLGYIIEIFPRLNEVYRKVAGKRNDRQVLAANVDSALIVQGLDLDFNIMRLDRYLVQMINCGVEPVVILNKADLVTDLESYRSAIQKLGRNCVVYFCSTYTGYGMDVLAREIFVKAKTYMMIGSSGVGKSSILKWLKPDLTRETKDVSTSTGKGVHTTTTRDLYQLLNGSLLIDTPGMREFGLAIDSDQNASSLFPVIDDYAVECRFSDCKHLNEEGCGVVKALEDGKLSSEAYESYLKLIKEQRRFELKAGDQKRLGKQFGKMSREAQDFRKKYKY